MGAGNFRNLEVWVRSKEVAVEVYRLCRENPLASDFGLRDQICRAAVSIASNIAEGNEKEGSLDRARFFETAAASAAETETQLILCREVGYIQRVVEEKISEDLQHIRRILNSMVRKLRNQR